MSEMTLYQQVIHKTRYARWIEGERRREDWPETVDRYINHFCDHLKTNFDYTVPKKVREQMKESITGLDVMPSMRALMTAGPALTSANVANYNCAFLPIDSTRSFAEHMFVLMCGAGSGFSIERRHVEKLPEVPEELHPTDTVVKVSDSRKGWCVALNQILSLLYSGSLPTWDVSKVRPEGSRLNTFGGYASGPGPLVDLFEHIVDVFKSAKGRKLKPVEAFSIACYIAQIVVVGGVRRSATIGLFDKDDIEMRRAKSGQWWVTNPHFAMANVSAVYESKPDPLEFMDMWRDLIASGSGEPGILNRKALWESCEKIGRETRYPNGERIPFGVNPCAEIILRPYQFCNLTGAAIRPNEAWDTIAAKVDLATVLGTWQATIDDFDYLRKVWKDNVVEERLLGVCLAGIMDHGILNSVNLQAYDWLHDMLQDAKLTNGDLAPKIGINPAAAVTAIKPAGNSGEMYNVASGIHPRYAPYYIRTIRQSNGDPMTQFLKDNGIPWEVSKMNERDIVFSFPVKAPENATFAKDMSALEQLDHWLMVKTAYAEHTVSCTVYVKKDEWVDVGAWVYNHFDNITGLSFLPYDDHTYEQAPYQPISKEEYDALAAEMPASIDWSLLTHYEEQDTTTVSQEFACTAGQCSLT